MPPIAPGDVAADPWRLIAEGEDIPAGEPVILDLARLEEEAEHLFHRGCCLGVLMRPDEPADRLAPWLRRLALIALAAEPGRESTLRDTARALRQRHGFTGEIRAMGLAAADDLSPVEGAWATLCAGESLGPVAPP